MAFSLLFAFHLHSISRKNNPNLSSTRKKFGLVLHGGAYWTRTSDPIDVNDVLYQLSQSTVILRTNEL